MAALPLNASLAQLFNKPTMRVVNAKRNAKSFGPLTALGNAMSCDDLGFGLGLGLESGLATVGGWRSQSK